MSCKCAQCFTLAEFMRAETGKDYGLTPAPGHAPPDLPPARRAPSSSSMTDLDPGEFERLQKRAQQRRSAKRFPWEEAA